MTLVGDGKGVDRRYACGVNLGRIGGICNCGVYRPYFLYLFIILRFDTK